MSSDIFDSVFEEQNFGANIHDGDVFDSINIDTKQQPSKLSERLVRRGNQSFLRGDDRQILRSLSRYGETIAGMPGDIEELAMTGGDFLLDKLGLSKYKSEPSFILPTSSDLTGIMNKATGGFLEPQTSGERFSDEIIKDAAALFLGNKIPTKGGAIYKTFKSVKPFLVSLGSNLAKEGAALLGASPVVQETVKLGTMFLSSLANKPSVNNLKENLYKDARSKLPKGAEVSAKRLQKNLSILEEKLLEGGDAASKSQVKTKISEINGKIKDGKISIKELQAFKQDVNEITAGISDTKNTKLKLKSNVNELRKNLRSSISEYGKENPAFIESWNKAEEVHGAISQSQKVRDTILSSLKQNPKLSLIGATGLGIKTGGAAVPALAGAGATMLTGEFIAKAMKSPTIRKHYGKVLASALKDNTPVLTRNLYALNRAVEKEGFGDD